MIELYDVTTVASKIGGYKNVKFHWYLPNKTRRRSYADLIENYNPSRYCPRDSAEDCIDELFELDQANALKEYLELKRPGLGTPTIEKVELPIPNNSHGAAPPWGFRPGEFAFGLDEDDPDYSLPFKVRGYVSVRGCEPADDSEARELADGSEACEWIEDSEVPF
jgi:hypothetical protein